MADELYPGAREAIWYGDRKVYSVTGFVLGVRSRIVDLPSMWISGEISELNAKPHLSMVYFKLKDPRNAYELNCTMPRRRYEALGLQVQNGDKVQVMGRAEIYAKKGTFQLVTQTMEFEGRGLLMQQLEQLTARLQAEGLFDESRKAPLPFLPRRVGVITGAGAAAQGDFLRNVVERCPTVDICMIETLVQGDRAAPLLVAALQKLQRMPRVDVIVVTRGGGAFEDFLPFCDERFCRAIAACPIPVVSAIGHEKDSPISDLVADLRVSTPTAAARTVVPDWALVCGGVERNLAALRRRGEAHVITRRDRAIDLRRRLSAHSPEQLVVDRRLHVDALRVRTRATVEARIERGRMRQAAGLRARSAMARRVGTTRTRIDGLLAHLRAISPQSTLARGYAIVRSGDGVILRAGGATQVDEQVTITLARGRLSARVTEVEPGAADASGDRAKAGTHG